MKTIQLGLTDRRTGIDLQPALNRKFLRPSECITLYNKQEGEFKGKRMITMPDLYRVAKIGSNELLSSLRRDFIYVDFMMSTVIDYSPHDLSAKIIHNYGSDIPGVNPSELFVAEVPHYRNEPATKVVEGKGLAYARALFHTKDKSSKILGTLEKLAQREAKSIVFFTWEQCERDPPAHRIINLFYDTDHGSFCLDACDLYVHDNFDDEVRSRGVLLNQKRK